MELIPFTINRAKDLWLDMSGNLGEKLLLLFREMDTKLLVLPYCGVY